MCVRGGAGPGSIVACEELPSTSPDETFARVVGFFRGAPRPPQRSLLTVDLHVGSAHWGRSPRPKAGLEAYGSRASTRA